MKNKLNSGSVLVFTLIMMFMLLSLAMAVISTTAIERKLGGATGKSVVAFQVADSGSETILNVLRKQPPDRRISDFLSCTNNIVTGNASGGSYSVTFWTNDVPPVQISCGDPISKAYQIKSVGMFAGATRAVQVAVAADFWTLQSGNPANILSTNTGNIGIGSTNPLNKLTVQGGGAGNVDLAVTGRILTGDANHNGGVWLNNPPTIFIGDVGSGTLGLFTSGAGWAFQLAQNGNVNIPGVISGNTGGSGARISGRGGNAMSFDWGADGKYHMWVDNTEVMAFNPWNFSKNFIINHPLDDNKYLIHTTLEGPENAVFYRGEGQLENGIVEINLPDYFEALTQAENRTVLLTPIFENEKEGISGLAASEVKDGKFKVRSIDNKNPNQKFSWEVKAVRKDIAPLLVEPNKDQIDVYGDGPYKYYRLKQ